MSSLVDRFGQPLSPSGRSASVVGGAPHIPDGGWNYGFYDAVNYSTNRAARAFFATDSRYTLTTWSRERAMALSRWSYINVPVVRGAVDLFARLTVGTGFVPKTVCKDPGLGTAADQLYLERTRNIGFMKGESIDELLLHDCRSIDVDGGIGHVLTQDEFGTEKIQTIEDHRIKNGDITDPHCLDGVWFDDFARISGYNVALPGSDEGTRRIDTRSFIYLNESNRPDEHRSMTKLIHALAPLQDLYEIIGFAMASAKKNSEFAALIETNTPNDPPGLGPTLDTVIRQAVPAQSDQPAVPKQMVTREQVYGGGGKIPILRPGESFKSYSHDQPSPTIEQWAEFIVRGIAVGYGVPFEVLWNPETIGGANTRMILGLLATRLRERRRLLQRNKLARIRFWILSRAIKRGELKYSPELLRCAWNPTFTDLTVDAGRESRERRANVIAGLDTFTNYFADNGEEYDDQVEIRKQEVAKQCAAAEWLAAKFPNLSFEAALARIALLTQNAAEVSPTLTRAAA